ncbi:MAG: LuxR C-terminal-related transcriptional regulator [Aeromicrobium sp.]
MVTPVDLDAAEDLRELARLIVADVRGGSSALVTGPSGTGKSTLLRAIGDELTAAGLAVQTLRTEDPADVGPAIADDHASILLIDHLEGASSQLLEATATHAARDGRVIAAFETGRHPRAYSSQVLRTVYGTRPLGRDATQVRRDHLEPLDEQEMARFLHLRCGDDVLDSGDEHAITELARGRRSWAVDLVQLARANQLQWDPFPAVNPLATPGESPLPALEGLRASLAGLSPECAAAAVALSGIEPLDELGLSALVDPSIVETLLVAGVLVPSGEPHELAVPGFVATALRQRVPFDEVERQRRSIATALLGQELIGVPLSERDAIYCVRALSPDDPLDDGLALAHRRLVIRTVTRLTTFGEPTQVRAAVLRLASHGLDLPDLARARALAALGRTTEALAVVDGVDDDGPSLGATEFVRRLLLADAGATTASDGARGRRTQDSADLVLSLWNRTDPLGDDAARVRSIADGDDDPTLAALAALLVDLDAVWAGRVPPYTSTLHAPKALPGRLAPTEPEMCDVAGTILVAQALVLLMIGESTARREALLDLAARLPDRDFHDRWLRHIIAAGTAATFGEMTRAGHEWQLFAASVPRLVPLRLRHYVDRVGVALDAVTDTSSEPDGLTALNSELPYRILLYFAGLHGPLQRLRQDLESTPGTLPLIRLARAHLDATHERNPAQLMRLTEHFRKYRMWLPTAYALSDARRIYLGRRAVGKVRECDEELDAVRSEIARHAPWRAPDAPVKDLAVTLTPRELVTAHLAAQGLSNRDIAEQLECGVRTVESHLSQARAKLGASSREDLARLLPGVEPN